MNIKKRWPAGMLLLMSPMVDAQTLPNAPIYTYTVLGGGYAANGNLTNYGDSVTGTWAMQYDDLNRLQGANATSGPYSSAAIGWQYDFAGNRLNQSVSGTPSVAIPSSWATYYSNNQVATNQIAPDPKTLNYDRAGNMTADGINQVQYDAENRVCAVAVYNAGTMNTTITMYLYDAEGNRVAKGHPASSTSTLYCPTSRADFAPDELYILDQNGEQVSELDGDGNWKRSNIFEGGQLLATYDQEGSAQPLHFYIADPLGTKRVQASATGMVEQKCLSLPFGDGLTCNGASQDATERYFTGKERDTESGLDYFGARYYGSSMGRFMSPDWSAQPKAIPYADVANPQSLNLYAYVLNNPLSAFDPEGHVSCNDAPGLCRAITDSVSQGGTIQQGWDSYNQSQLTTAAQNYANGATSSGDTKFKLILGGTLISGSFGGRTSDSGFAGLEITADPQGCDNCRWSQVAQRSDQNGGQPFTDRPRGEDSPLYPIEALGKKVFNDLPGFNPGTSGTWSAVTFLGTPDFARNTFSIQGAFTYGFIVSKPGVIGHIKAPRLASSAQAAAAQRVLRSDSPSWTIR